MVWRFVRTLLILAMGAVAGFAGAAWALRGALPSRGDETSDELALVAIYNGIDLTNRSAAFRGGTVLAWFGGVALDLREATLVSGAQIDVRALFGGAAIRVPITWRVDATATSFAGGADSRTAQPDDPDAPVLIVRAVSAFGGVAVTN